MGGPFSTLRRLQSVTNSCPLWDGRAGENQTALPSLMIVRPPHRAREAHKLLQACLARGNSNYGQVRGSTRRLSDSPVMLALAGL